LNVQGTLSRDDRRIKQIHAHHLVLCLQAIPTNRIESVFTGLQRGPNLGQYVRAAILRHFPSNDIHERLFMFIEDWNFIGPIRSRQELDERLEEIRARVG
jgi:hypothetical protein